MEENNLLELVEGLLSLNDENLAKRVLDDNDVQWCLGELDDMLMSDAKPVIHAKWLDKASGFYCSSCKFRAGLHPNGKGAFLSKYCPKCGAKMDLEDNCNGK